MRSEGRQALRSWERSRYCCRSSALSRWRAVAVVCQPASERRARRAAPGKTGPGGRYARAASSRAVRIRTWSPKRSARASAPPADACGPAAPAFPPPGRRQGAPRPRPAPHPGSSPPRLRARRPALFSARNSPPTRRAGRQGRTTGGAHETRGSLDGALPRHGNGRAALGSRDGRGADAALPQPRPSRRRAATTACRRRSSLCPTGAPWCS